MPPISDQAICLRRLDYSESSQVLVLLTRQHGKQRLIAKGIKRPGKKRLAVGVDLLELGQVCFWRRTERSETLGILTEWSQRQSFLAVRADLQRLYAAQYAAEITAELTAEADPHVGLFDGLVALLEALAAGAAPLEALLGFARLLLQEVGLTPELSRCVSCGRRPGPREPLYLSAGEGGLICRDCESARLEKHRVTAAAVEAFRSPPPASHHAALQAFDLLDYYISHAMRRRPRVSALLRSALGPGG